MMNFYNKVLFFCLLINIKFSSGEPIENNSRSEAFEKISKAIESLGTNLLIDLYSESAPNENLLISPLNIYHALSLIHLAAGGNTLKELSNILEISKGQNYSKSHIHSTIGSYFKDILTTDSDPVILNVADALFVRDGFEIKKDYYTQVKKLYDANVESINFNLGKIAANKINGWVSNKTRDRIQGVVNENIDSSTEALIISTLYFNAKWKESFSKYHTKTEKFFNGVKEVDVQMMSLEELFPYVKNDDLQFESIDLYCEDSYYAMNIILPYPTQTIKNLTSYLKNISVKEIMKNAKGIINVDLKLPKVKFTTKTSLVNALKHLGIRDLFSSPNLSDLSTAPFRVSEVFHGTEIQIDEEGIIGTAVTSAHIVPASLPYRSPNPIHFHVKRPFIINIYNHKTSMVLFSGFVYEPEQ